MSIIFQEAAVTLPRLSQSSLYQKFDQQSHITQTIREAIEDKTNYVTPESMKEIMSLIRLNGSPNAKRAAQKFDENKLIIIYNKDRLHMSNVMPFFVRTFKNGDVIPYVFANTVVTNITSTAEYPNLMATMEAAYLAACLVRNQNQMLLNRQLVLGLCELYNYLWLMPLEQKLYIKGDNLTKAQMYIDAYFYRMIDGEKMTPQSIPYNRLLKDRVSAEQTKQIVTEVTMMPSLAIGNLIDLIKKINPVRYKELDSTFMSYFVQSCGSTVIFALENLQYLFLLLTSASYKTKVTAYGLNKSATTSGTVKKCMSALSGIDLKY